AGDRAVECDVAAVRPDQAAVVEVAVDHQPAAAGGLERARVLDDIGAGIDDQGMGAGGDDVAGIVQVELTRAQLASAGDGVVDVDQVDPAQGAGDDVTGVVGQ